MSDFAALFESLTDFEKALRVCQALLGCSEFALCDHQHVIVIRDGYHKPAPCNLLIGAGQCLAVGSAARSCPNKETAGHIFADHTPLTVYLNAVISDVSAGWQPIALSIQQLRRALYGRQLSRVGLND